MRVTANSASRFASDKQGAVALIFALVITIVMGMIGLGIDGGRAYQAAGRATAALDAAALAAAVTMVALEGARADSSGPSSGGGASSRNAAGALYEEALEKISDARYRKAIKLLKKANRRDSGNPDILNMLAFSERKLGNLKAAFSYYGRALELRPPFPEAREYLGEAHIDAALRQLALLRSYGEDGKQAHASLLDALKRAAAGGDADATGQPRSW